MPPHILVVDDHPQYLQTVCQMLELYIAQVRLSTAGDGSAALRLFQQHSFDLLLIDYQLQTKSGSELVRQMRARAAAAGWPMPPVILMSSQPDVAIFARTLGVAAFLPKPILGDDLRSTVLPILERDEVVGPGRRPLLWRVSRHDS